MSLNRCPICGELLIWQNHKCDPAWRVWHDDDLVINADLIFAKNEQAAAERFAEKAFYRGWYNMQSVDVLVVAAAPWDEWSDLDEDDDGYEASPAGAVKYEVTVEMVPSFSAVKEKKKEMQ